MTTPAVDAPLIGSYETPSGEIACPCLLVDEPDGQRPVVDAEGYAWIYRPATAAELVGRWVRQVLIVIDSRRCITDPAIGDHWTDVIAAGPARLAGPDDDTSIAYLHYPLGWRHFTPVGAPVRLPPHTVSALTLRRGGLAT